jgi:Right handed beta helix region
VLSAIDFTARPLPAAAHTCEATSHGSWYPNSPTRDSSTGLSEALASPDCAGQTLHIPAGTYYFLPTALTVGFNIPANTTIKGDADQQGNPVTKLVVGTQANGQGNYDSFFKILDVSGVSIQYLDFQGSQDATGCPRNAYPGFGNAIEVIATRPQQSIENVTIQHNQFHNFNGQFWIYLHAHDQSAGIGVSSPIDIGSNLFDAAGNDGSNGRSPALANCAGSVGLGWGVYQVWIQGNGASGSGAVANVNIASNTFYANYVKGAIAVFGGNLRRISIQHNQIYDAGRGILETSTSKELGRYAIMVYDGTVAHSSALRPNDVRIVDNKISAPVSCGIYVASGINVQISQNVISGQTDSYDVTLPKGAIALNGLLNPNPVPSGNVFQVSNNSLSDNHYGIEVAGGTGMVNGNGIIDVPENGIGIRVSLSDPGVGVPTSLAFTNNTIATIVADKVVTSMIGFGPLPLGDSCSGTVVLPDSTLTITGLTQIGWSPGSQAPSLSWLDSRRKCHYRGFGPDAGKPYLTPLSNLITNVTRQGGPNSAAVTQPAFWPYDN